MSSTIISNTSLNPNMVDINCGSKDKPAYYSINKSCANDFYNDYKSLEKTNKLISDIGMFISVSTGYIFISKVANKLSTVPKFILGTIGGISLSLITSPIINAYTQNRSNKLENKYNAKPIIV